MINKEENAVRVLPILPLRGLTSFPEMLIHFDVGRSISAKALEVAMKDGQVIFLATQKDIKIDKPKEEDLYRIGTICVVKQIIRSPNQGVRVLVEGKARGRINNFVESNGKYLVAEVEVLEEKKLTIREEKKEAMIRVLCDKYEEYCEMTSQPNIDFLQKLQEGEEIGHLVDYVVQSLNVDFIVKQEMLEELDPIERAIAVINLLADEISITEIENQISVQVKEQIDKHQREYYLREQIKVIQTELGDMDIIAEAEDYRKKIIALKLEEEHEKKLLREADRLAKLGSNNAESGVVRSYLEACLELPWNKKSKEINNLARASKILEKEHYGMEKVKERILEFLAVKALNPNLKGQVICLAGPPGVGKTSVAKSIAKAMGREYTRLSLGGVRDEADIRGHRKTYIGAMPGRIVQSLRQVGTKNPLILLDEIDKMGSDFKGDPSSALLEVLDIEQNTAFRDHYIELPFDLSDVLFVTTANDLGSVPRPLLDRMEVIELASYTLEEKTQIAKRHLLPKQMKMHGIKRAMLSISDVMLREVVSSYTKEAGVRGLERVLAKICRKSAKKIVDDEELKKVTINQSNIEEILGVKRYKEDVVAKHSEVGIVNGLAWTSVGGTMLQVEVATVAGTGKIEVTGNLGKVMQESTKAAITYVRSCAEKLEINPMFYKETDVHIHFPEAAIPKDGPSAGITITTALVSSLTGIPVRHDVAMTGEVTLRGRVLPIGGLREKTMAAYTSKIKTVVIPKDNEKDLQDIEPIVSQNVNFVIAETMDTVLDTALDFSKKPKIKKQKIHSENIPIHQNDILIDKGIPQC